MTRFLIPLLSVLSLAAEPISDRLAADIADAIWRAEGGAKAKQPYGITTVRVRGQTHAREIALGAIREEWDRWERAGRRGGFYAAFARRWCPPSHDLRGHRNLVRNLTAIMREANLRAATQ